MTSKTTILIPPTSTQTVVRVEASHELSGKQWTNKFPSINTLSELAEPFKNSVTKFFAAMQDAGISVDMNRLAIYRPPQRSYLMHYAKRITTSWPGYEQLKPEDVPAFQSQGGDMPVSIDWVHKGADGKSDLAASKKAAAQMVEGYGIGKNPVAPPYSSRHNNRPSNAIDIPPNAVTIPSDCKVKEASGKGVAVKKYADLYPIGETYGVYKLLSDPPHWSNDGH